MRNILTRFVEGLAYEMLVSCAHCIKRAQGIFPSAMVFRHNFLAKGSSHERTPLCGPEFPASWENTGQGRLGEAGAGF